ncbi:MAG: hypothetical protein KVP17_001863 [Porospora cf. gigantea B]|uniref:uncharacterized protein n=1 Tax=Porospora cf. gigantea B TaxID=2853592 RepID=UPI003571B00B|nr:MAG: hypothetical protein KVP17_001863 [Porospora cf. gigantea B]
MVNWVSRVLEPNESIRICVQSHQVSPKAVVTNRLQLPVRRPERRSWQKRILFTRRHYGNGNSKRQRHYLKLIDAFERCWSTLRPLVSPLEALPADLRATAPITAWSLCGACSPTVGVSGHYGTISFLVMPSRFEAFVPTSRSSSLADVVINSQAASDLPETLTLFVLIGGKDQLALDWLPFVSRVLHSEIQRCVAEHAGDKAQLVLRGALNAAFVLVEFPGHGTDEGVPSPARCHEAVLGSVHQSLEILNVSRVKLILVGYSLGASIALSVAKFLVERQTSIQASGREMQVGDTTLQMAGASLIAPFTSIPDVVAHLLRIPRPLQRWTSSAVGNLIESDIQWSARDDMRELVALLSSHADGLLTDGWRKFHLTVIAGSEDTTVPAVMSLELLQRALAQVPTRLSDRFLAEFVEIKGARHQTLTTEAQFVPPICDVLLPRLGLCRVQCAVSLKQCRVETTTADDDAVESDTPSDSEMCCAPASPLLQTL